MLVTNEVLERYTGRGLAAYLVRGALAAILFSLGLWLSSGSPAFGFALMLLALLPLGGCPACWLGGTIEAACQLKPGPKTSASSNQ